MTNRTTSTMEQLNQLSASGSKIHAASKSTNPEPIEVASNKPRGIMNLINRMRQTQKEGKVKTILQASQADNQLGVAQYLDDAASQNQKFQVDLKRVVMDEKTEKRAQHELRVIGNNTLIGTSDAIHLATLYSDEKISVYSATIQDETLRDKAINEQRFIHARQVTDIRLASFGSQFEIDGDYNLGDLK